MWQIISFPLFSLSRLLSLCVRFCTDREIFRNLIIGRFNLKYLNVAWNVGIAFSWSLSERFASFFHVLYNVDVLFSRIRVRVSVCLVLSCLAGMSACVCLLFMQPEISAHVQAHTNTHKSTSWFKMSYFCFFGCTLAEFE